MRFTTAEWTEDAEQERKEFLESLRIEYDIWEHRRTRDMTYREGYNQAIEDILEEVK